jgi:hypothetical protein
MKFMRLLIADCRLLIVAAIAALSLGSNAFGQNVFIANDTTHPVPVTVISGGGGGGGAATIADGADVTQGAKADAKSTATDTTAVSIMSVLKEISFMLQNPASISATNGSIGAGTTVASTALEASHVLKAGTGTLVSVSGYNSKTSAQFIQVHNSTTVPADTAVPTAILSVGPQQNFNFDVPLTGMSFSTGIGSLQFQHGSHENCGCSRLLVPSGGKIT